MKSRFVTSCALAILLGAGAIAASAPVVAKEASGISYAKIPAGAYSIVAEVRAAEAELLDGYVRDGVSEVIVVFRNPVDLETIERVGELRTALAAMIASA